MKKGLLSIVYALTLLLTLSIMGEENGRLLLMEKNANLSKIAEDSVHACKHPLVHKAGFAVAPKSYKNDILSAKMEREEPWGLAKKVMGKREVKVLALRIEFQPDCDPASTGNGLFDLRDSLQFLAEEGHEIDRAPHNRKYFENHLEALKRYYYFVSDNQLSINYDVYPKELNKAYRLPYPMVYYGQRGPFNGWNESLGTFTYDAVRLADSLETGIEFDKYDVVVIFHAGSDWQSDMAGMQDSPDDLPGVNVFMGEPIPVDGGAHSVLSAMVIPETTCQDNRINALNGLLAHEFGHQLGLPDFYSTIDFRPFVGNFALMDAGNLIGVSVGGLRISSGALPCYPCAWSRAYLGFNEVVTINEPMENVACHAAELFRDDNKIYKVPINAHEYFLIENRRTQPGDEPVGLYLVDGVIAGPANMNKEFVGAYDYLIPGSGLLIWHVDETVAKMDFIKDDGNPNNFSANTLQLDVFHPFLVLEEADGSRDIGVFVNSEGTGEDMFRADNNDDFGPSSNPNSSSNCGLNSGIEIYGISEAKDVMTFSVNMSASKLRPSFYKQYPFPVSFKHALAEDLTGNGYKDAVFVSDSDDVYILFQDENGYQLPSDFFNHDFGDSLGKIFHLPIKFPPAVTDLNANGLKELAFYSEGNMKIYEFAFGKKGGMTGLTETGGAVLDTFNQGPCFYLPEENMIYFASGDALCYYKGGEQSVFSLPLGYGKIESILYLENAFNMTKRVLASTEYGKMLVVPLSLNSDEVKVIALSGRCGLMGHMVPAYLDDDEILDFVLLGTCGAIHVINENEEYLPGFPKNINEQITGGPVVYDLDDDSFPEIMFYTKMGLHVLNYNGTESENFPYFWDDTSKTVSGSPLLIRNGETRILASTPDNKIVCLNSRGDMDEELSYPLDGLAGASLLIAETQGAGESEIIAATDKGGVTIIPLNGEFSNVESVWPQWGYDNNQLIPVVGDKSKKITQLDKRVIKDNAHNFPNPVRDGKTNFYYTLYDKPATVEIALYDYSGKEVYSVVGTSYLNTENIIPVDLSFLEPDVYILKFTAKHEGKKEIVYSKTAIIR